jgi:nucleoid-associated protein YgaU
MSLQEKYARLITSAKEKGAGSINVAEKDNVLYIDGNVNSAKDKDDLWKIYNEIDPDYRAGDLRLNIEVAQAADMEEYTVKKGDSLSKIASHYGIKWKDIFEANKDIIKNPDLIQPGWKLKIPGKK